MTRAAKLCDQRCLLFAKLVVTGVCKIKDLGAHLTAGLHESLALWRMLRSFQVSPRRGVEGHTLHILSRVPSTWNRHTLHPEVHRRRSISSEGSRPKPVSAEHRIVSGVVCHQQVTISNYSVNPNDDCSRVRHSHSKTYRYAPYPASVRIVLS